ncbi:MAG: hypothetical protein LC775_10115 [Acidobacteria bacterium]|nr:hypothetical protein [Acidobacteriota bacterium]
MIVLCAGQCGRHLYAASADGKIYLCRTCWRALFSVLFNLVGRGTEVFTVVIPQEEELS